MNDRVRLLGAILVMATSTSAAQHVWEQRYDAGFAESGRVVAVDAAGDVHVAGNADSDYLLIKYDADGNQLWLTQYGSSSFDTLKDMVVDDTGTVFLTGESNRSGTLSDLATAAYGPDGSFLWDHVVDGEGDVDTSRAIALAPGGGVVVAGNIRTVPRRGTTTSSP
jgi:hypothetical protein